MTASTLHPEPAPGKAGDPHPVDVHVGQRVRLRRTLLGMSQEALGERLGLSFQQVQKYEKGRNRVSASRLHRLCHLLDVPVSYFFDGLDGEAPDEAAPAADDPMVSRETLEFVRAYYRIPGATARKRLFELTKAIGRAAAGEVDD